MLTPDQIRRMAVNKYPHFLREHFAGRSIFPYAIPFGRPRGANQLAQVAEESRILMEGSASRLGYGYAVETEFVGTRLGQQRFPVRVFFPDRLNYLRYLGKETEFASIEDAIRVIALSTPSAADWARANPLKVSAKIGLWPDLCMVINHLLSHPRPNCYPRELPLPVSGKLLGEEWRLLVEILATIPGPHWQEGPDYFAQLGLRRPPAAFVRFRFLDPECRETNCFPVDDVSVSLDTFIAHPIQARRIVVIENIMTFLSFPVMADSVAVFGEGKAGERMVRVPWLRECELWYWGDIDPHGMEILRTLRRQFPHLRSLFMNQATLETYRGFAIPGARTETMILEGLTTEEAAAARAVYEGELLLEQEKLPQPAVVELLLREGLLLAPS